MNTEVLNKKLAVWAGFQEQKNRWHFELTKKILDWLFPTPWDHIGKLPNFTQHLDACFKWLVPEAAKRFGDTAVEELLIQWAEDLMRYGRLGNEALTLCLAIEKLIDGGGKMNTEVLKGEGMNEQDRLKQVIEEAARPYLIRGILDGFETAILESLSKEGVVRKIDGELPAQNNKCILWDLYQKGWLESQQSMRLAGYEATVPLIKEE